jgi:hypothetical protein
MIVKRVVAWSFDLVQPRDASSRASDVVARIGHVVEFPRMDILTRPPNPGAASIRGPLGFKPIAVGARPRQPRSIEDPLSDLGVASTEKR